MSVLVIGCGVSGLTCAIRLAEAGRTVRIVARELPPRTTSDVAAALWYPYRALPHAMVSRWARRSHEVFERLAQRTDTGVIMRTVTEIFRTPQPDPSWRDALRSFRRMRADELPVGFADGYVFEAPVIDTRRFMPWLMERARSLDVAIEVGTLGSLDRVQDEVVVNCAGLGARELVPDPEVFAIRGQVVQIENPGIDSVSIDEHNPEGIAYIVPRGSDCILGGTAQDDDERIAADDAETEAIVSRCAGLDSRVATVPRLAVRVGLRPGRSTVRLEAAAIGTTLVVHNYGHGGAGVTLSWGCAEDVVDLVRRLA
jgi:D-amino-acid oxidase